MNEPAVSSGDQPAPASFRIVSGHPSPEEIAAVTVVLCALAQADSTPPGPARPVGGWADPSARLRRPVHPGPGAWRTS